MVQFILSFHNNHSMEIWIEKHRPEKIEDIGGQAEAVRILKGFISSGEMPHLIFAGPPGVGKTTAALCMAKEMIGENWRDHFLELNASNDRGINIIREDIKDFARTQAITEGKFKIVFLDEADELTPEAQAALRRTMEVYFRNVRFIFSCNYSSGIIPPIQSRAVVIRFGRIESDDMKQILKKIIASEKMNLNEEIIDAIAENASGDMRKGLNILQSLYYVENPETRDVYEIAGNVEEKKLVPLLSNSRHGNYDEASSIAMDLLINGGYSAIDIVKGLHTLIIKERSPIILKRESIIALSDVETRLVQGGSDKIQLDYLVARLCKIYTENS